MTDELDEKIKQTLTAQTKELDSLMQGGLKNYLRYGFDNRFGAIMKLGYVIAIVLTALIFLFGYHFFTAAPENQLFWGVLLVLVFNAQVAVKLWIFMQTNRNILSREMRLLELRLSSQK